MKILQVSWTRGPGDTVIIARRVEIADNFFSRGKGLLGRSFLAPQTGLLIRPCNSIHTFFMQFPIDVIFLDGQGQVIKIQRNLAPWRLVWPSWRATQVLELPAQTIPDDLPLMARLDLCINS
ncbi:MAG: DUF192 domain-containing protein [Bacteriovoracaceae bacterium]|nr:DUF192 domain-containing protein [Bacteriovoracaceae bacterium]